jgi:transcriptional regulator with XRE-family HTH domain
MDEVADRVPEEVVYRILVNGESGLALLRDWRGLTVKELAIASGLTPMQIEAVEDDLGDPDDALIEQLARGLRVTPEVLVAMYGQDDSDEASGVRPANDP